MSRPQHDDDEFDDEMMPMEFDLAEALGGLLTNDDGNNLAGILTEINTSVKDVVHQLEMHNKIMVKLLTALTPKPPQGIQAPA
jgi:hypothetical protein